MKIIDIGTYMYRDMDYERIEEQRREIRELWTEINDLIYKMEEEICEIESNIFVVSLVVLFLLGLCLGAPVEAIKKLVGLAILILFYITFTIPQMNLRREAKKILADAIENKTAIYKRGKLLDGIRP